MRTGRIKNIQERYLTTMKKISFDTIVAGVLQKSESAQMTLLYKFVENVDGNVLALLHSYVQKEIKRRVKEDSKDAQNNKQQLAPGGTPGDKGA